MSINPIDHAPDSDTYIGNGQSERCGDNHCACNPGVTEWLDEPETVERP